VKDTVKDTVKDMRTELVEAALAVLHREGAAGLTVRNISQEAGCSTTGVYTYFGGKHGLVEAIFLDGFDSFDDAVRPGLESGDLRSAGRAYRRWALDHRTQYMVMFGRAVPDYVPSVAAHERALLSFARLADGVHRAAPGDDFAERAYHMFATVHGYVMLEMAEMSAATDTESEALYERALQTLGGR
jgi:AcrR family transcriptional regulator